MIKAAILTVSDSCSKGQREDVSGQTIRNMLSADKFEICGYKVVADEHQSITKELINFADVVDADIVLTTGGTGLGPRDVTPETTAAVCQKIVPGLAEAMRLEGSKRSRNAILSRAVAGIRGNTLIINLPGSPKAVKESLEAVLNVLDHAVDMVAGLGH